MCISSDEAILRPVCVLYYPTVEKVETFLGASPGGVNYMRRRFVLLVARFYAFIVVRFLFPLSLSFHVLFIPWRLVRRLVRRLVLRPVSACLVVMRFVVSSVRLVCSHLRSFRMGRRFALLVARLRFVCCGGLVFVFSVPSRVARCSSIVLLLPYHRLSSLSLRARPVPSHPRSKKKAKRAETK